MATTPTGMPAGQGQPGVGDNLSQSSSVADFLTKLIGIKQQKRNQNDAKIQSAFTLANQGFPIDASAFSKMLKNSNLGHVISTKEEDWKAFVDNEKETKQGGASQQQGQQQQQPQTGGKPAPFDRDKVMGQYVNMLASRARQMMNTQATTEQQKAENEQHITSLMSQAIAGDDHARGRLQGLGGIKFDANYEQWNGLDQPHKDKMYDVMAGMESDAEKASRGQRMGEGLLSSGRVTDPSAAYRMGGIMAAGGAIPPDLQSKVKPYTFSELADQTKAMNTLVEMGVPVGKLGAVMQAANAGGLENALPSGMKPVILQQLKLQGEQVGLEGSRLKLEGLRFAKEVETAHRMDIAAQSRAMSEQAKADVESFKSLVEIKKAGGVVSDDLIKGATAKAARALGMDVNEVNNTFHFLTGGTHMEFAPHMSEEGKSTVDKFSGKANKSPEPSSMQKVLRTFLPGTFKEGDDNKDPI